MPRSYGSFCRGLAKEAGDSVVCRVVGGVQTARSMQGLQASASEEVTGNFRLFA